MTVCGAEAVGAAVTVAEGITFDVRTTEDIAEKLIMFDDSAEDGSGLDEETRAVEERPIEDTADVVGLLVKLEDV